MAGAIKGITVQFRGKTDELDKALDKIYKEAKTVDDRLKAVNRALKFNPKNAELMKQKFTLLSQKIDKTTEELNTLKSAEKTLKANNVSKQSAEWMEVRRRIIEAESKLKNFKAQLASVKYANLAALGKAFQSAGQKMRTAGTYATIGGAAMVLAGKKLLALNQTQESAERKLVEIYKTRMGVNKKAAKSTMALASALQEQGVIGDEVTLSGAQQLATYAKMPETVNKLLPAMDDLLVQQKGYNATADDATGIANLFGKAMMGQTGALKRVGISFTEEQEKVLKYGTEEEKAAMLAEVVTQNVGHMNKEFQKTDEGKMVQLSNTLGDIGERLGHVLLPALGQAATWISEKLMPKIEALVGYLEGHPLLAKIAVAITAFLVVGGPLLIFLGGIISAVGTIMGAMGSIMTALGALLSPIGLVIAAIAGAIAIGVLVYKNWDKIKAKIIAIWTAIKAKALSIWNGIKTAIVSKISAAKTSVISLVKGLKDSFVSKVSSLKNSIQNTFSSIKDKMISPIKTAKSKIKDIVDKVKGFFPIKVENLLSHIKLPHFKITGSFSIKKKTVPHLSIDWHKEGGIFTRPTLLGNGTHGVGEAGAEAVIPLDTLWSHMNQMADSIVNGIGQQTAMASSGGGAVNITLYAFPNGPQMGQWVVNTYDKYKKQLG